MDDIVARHKKLARLTHPDVEDGDSPLMASINAARDIAVAAHHGTGVVPWSTGAELALATEQALVRFQERHTAAETAMKELTRTHVNRLRDLRNRAATAAGAAAIAALIPGGVDLVVKFAGPSKIVAAILTCYGLLTAAMFALRAVRASARARENERAIEEIEQTLDDKERFASVLNELNVYEGLRQWTADDVAERVHRWLHTTNGRTSRQASVLAGVRGILFDRAIARDRSIAAAARTVGADDFTRVLLRKGVERQLLVENDEWVGGHLQVTYRFLRGTSNAGDSPRGRATRV